MEFKKYFKQDEDVEKTLGKIPKSHQELVKGFRILFQPKNTLYGDEDHVGMIKVNPKEIHVASPWNVGREFTLLHEVGHLVYEKWIRGTKWQKRWEEIVKNTKDKKKDESAEELWCHNYANYFAKNKIVIHTHDEWESYLDDFVKQHG